jgi:hypothetical protein
MGGLGDPLATPIPTPFLGVNGMITADVLATDEEYKEVSVGKHMPFMWSAAGQGLCWQSLNVVSTDLLESYRPRCVGECGTPFALALC